MSRSSTVSASKENRRETANASAMPRIRTPSVLPAVQITQQTDLRPVMDHLAMDVQHQPGHRILLEPVLPARLAQTVVIQRPDAGDPLRIHVVQPGKGIGRRRWIDVGGVADRWA